MKQFGEQRLVRGDVGLGHRAIFRLMGVPDPAHYLHHKYVARALDILDEHSPEHVLDAGCGAGDHTFYLARRFPRAHVLGVDIDEALIARNRTVAKSLRLPNVHFEVASIMEPLPGAFDLIVSVDVLEHLAEQEKALRILRDALSPRGAAFFHVPTARLRPVPFSRWLDDFHAWAEEEHVADDLTADQFERVVKSAGFRVVQSWRTFGYWSGEMATSMFALPFRNTKQNRIFQVLLAPLCRALVSLDPILQGDTRYAIGLLLTKNIEDRPGLR